MEADHELEMLVELLEKRGVEVRHEACGSAGGLVKMKDRQVLFVNPRVPKAERIDVCLEALRKVGADGMFLPPHVREMLDRTT